MSDSLEGVNRPGHWKHILLASGPLLIIPALYLIGTILTPLLSAPSPPSYLGLVLIPLIVGLPLILMVVGWIKEFPRWAFPYWGFVLTIALYMYQFDGTVSSFWVTGSLWMWAPLAGVALVSLIWTRSLRPILALLKSIWEDWTLLSFTFYGALPLLFVYAYEEVRPKSIMVALILVLTASAFFYMRAKDNWRRFAWLVGGFALSWLGLMIHEALYWDGRWESWMLRPGTWIESVRWTGSLGLKLLLILVAPSALGIVKWAVKRLRGPIDRMQIEMQ